MRKLCCIGLALALAACAASGVDEAALQPIAYRIEGRAVCSTGEAGAAACLRQWPGGYVEAAFTGDRVHVRFGEGLGRFKISIDGHVHDVIRGDGPRLYQVEGLAPGRHVLRVDFISESFAGPTQFRGVFAPAPASLPRRAFQIEFIGDSHTAGYANTSATRECDNEEVWATTDAAQSHGAILAARLGADYRLHAISGRGVVRNYNGGPGDPLPRAYGGALFDPGAPAADAGWRPEIIVIALGTNDFSTALNPGEPWPDRAALQEDYQRAYAAFLVALRAAHPGALLVVWSADAEGGEIETQAGLTVARARHADVSRLVFAPIRGLGMGACHWHPSLADHAAIADAIAAAIEGAANP